MKKILALLLAITMVVCMFAGCNKTEEKPDDTKAPTTSVEDNKDDSKPTEPETPDATEPEDTEPVEGVVIEGRQEHWETVFANKEHKAAYESFKLNASGIMDTVCLTDGTQAYVSVAGKDDSGNTLEIGMLFVDAETIYLYQTGMDNGVEKTAWFKCVNITKGEEGEDTTDSLTETAGNDDDFNTAIENATRIEYVETLGKLDHVIVYYKAVDENVDNGMAIVFDSTVELEYNGVKGQYRHTKKSNGAGSNISATVTVKEIEGFDWNDWEFDAEKLTLTKGEEVIQCTLVKDHMTEEAAESKVEVFINYETSEIHKMILTDATGFDSTIEYIDCKSVADVIAPPAEVEEMEYEQAVMQFVFSILAIAMSGAGAN